ncbi:MAG: OsmC family protein [Acidobacteriota bacterium]
MAVEITGRYTGNLNVEIQHGPSGATIHTAAPVDNHGDGSSFSPTDLTAAALGACMLTVMGIVAARHEIDLSGMHFQLEKHMVSDPRRIGRIPVTITMPAGLDAKQRKLLERTANQCPVHKSLHDAVEKDVRFVYPD